MHIINRNLFWQSYPFSRFHFFSVDIYFFFLLLHTLYHLHSQIMRNTTATYQRLISWLYGILCGVFLKGQFCIPTHNLLMFLLFVCSVLAITLKQYLGKLYEGAGPNKNKPHHKTKTNQAKSTETKHTHQLAA